MLNAYRFGTAVPWPSQLRFLAQAFEFASLIWLCIALVQNSAQDGELAMKMWIGGQWTNGAFSEDVLSPFDNGCVGTVPVAELSDVEQAIASAECGTREMAALRAWQRSSILNRAADLAAKSVEEFAVLISGEEGKPLSEARGEASRLEELLRLCAFEGAQLRGEVLPLEAHAGTSGKIGLTLRSPCGIVAAITPFNYPLLLVAHKVGPALAAGNAVILKPAQKTPLSALRFTEILVEAGLPPKGIQCITGVGSKIGPAICADSRVRKISFTGSTTVGESITKTASIKRLSLELGSNTAVVVLPDADLSKVASAVTAGGYVNAGQVCISTQRVLVHRKVYSDFLDLLRPSVESIKTGDPAAPDTKLGPMISEAEAERVRSWIAEAAAAGARVVTGGERSGALLSPTIVADVAPTMRLYREELFGPAVAVTAVDSVTQAIEFANDTSYGLSAAIFTQDVTTAWRFARQAEAGNVHVNWTPLWRADLMPYGGLKRSGFGKEGPRYAVEEMTESKSVVFHEIGV
jgi:acyl-CoA reductase-like NAD-dependent aldehyde dehydrogenase